MGSPATIDGASEAPDRVARLDDGDHQALALQGVGGREPGHPGADDDAVHGVWHRCSVAAGAEPRCRACDCACCVHTRPMTSCPAPRHGVPRRRDHRRRDVRRADRRRVGQVRVGLYPPRLRRRGSRRDRRRGSSSRRSGATGCPPAGSCPRSPPVSPPSPSPRSRPGTPGSAPRCSPTRSCSPGSISSSSPSCADTRLRAHFERLALVLCLLVCVPVPAAGVAGMAALVGGRGATDDPAAAPGLPRPEPGSQPHRHGRPRARRVRARHQSARGRRRWSVSVGLVVLVAVTTVINGITRSLDRGGRRAGGLRAGRGSLTAPAARTRAVAFLRTRAAPPRSWPASPPWSWPAGWLPAAAG